MTDLAIAEPEALSTTLDTTTETGPLGAGVPRTLETEAPDPNAAKEPSLRDVVSDAVKDDAKPKADDVSDKEAEKETDKKVEVKDEAVADKKDKESDGQKKEETADKVEATKDADKPDDGDEPLAKSDKPTGKIEAPKNFLPDAKEKWVNTPRTVQRDVENMVRTHQEEVERYKAHTERYETIRDFDELAQQNGRDLRDSLMKVHQIENLMQSNPVAGLNSILLEAGPRKADGQPVSLFELAQHIVNQGQQGYQQMVSQRPQQQQQQAQANPEVEQLKQQVAQMQQQQLAASVIDPFKAANPRYDELKDDIALFLKSGKVPASLSPNERLEAAYDMAVRINPSSHQAAETDTDLANSGGTGKSFSSSKSIKSALGAITPVVEPERGGSIRDLLAEEAKRASRRSS